MSFIVTGCGRSGTTFLARLFNKIGVRTSHEEYFTAHTPMSTMNRFTEWCEYTNTAGEVSGLASPWLEDTTVPTARLVRNPVAVVASLMGLNDYDPGNRWLPNIKFNFRHLPQMNHGDPPIVLAMKYWLEWNRLAGSAKTFRVEEISQGQGAIEMLRYLGVETHRTECNDALTALGTRQNGGHRDPAVGWRTLPEADGLKDEIATQALAYGYAMADLYAYCPMGDNCPHCGPKPE